MSAPKRDVLAVLLGLLAAAAIIALVAIADHYLKDSGRSGDPIEVITK